jgi:hypothetical protein
MFLVMVRRGWDIDVIVLLSSACDAVCGKREKEGNVTIAIRVAFVYFLLNDYNLRIMKPENSG